MNDFAEVYAWVRRQPCISQDFVAVPIESLAELLRIESPPVRPPYNPEVAELQFLRSQEKFYRSRPGDLASICSLSKLAALEAKYATVPPAP